MNNNKHIFDITYNAEYTQKKLDQLESIFDEYEKVSLSDRSVEFADKIAKAYDAFEDELNPNPNVISSKQYTLLLALLTFLTIVALLNVTIPLMFFGYTVLGIVGISLISTLFNLIRQWRVSTSDTLEMALAPEALGESSLADLNTNAYLGITGGGIGFGFCYLARLWQKNLRYRNVIPVLSNQLEDVMSKSTYERFHEKLTQEQKGLFVDLDFTQATNFQIIKNYLLENEISHDVIDELESTWEEQRSNFLKISTAQGRLEIIAENYTTKNFFKRNWELFFTVFTLSLDIIWTMTCNTNIAMTAVVFLFSTLLLCTNILGLKSKLLNQDQVTASKLFKSFALLIMNIALWRHVLMAFSPNILNITILGGSVYLLPFIAAILVGIALGCILYQQFALIQKVPENPKNFEIEMDNLSFNNDTNPISSP